MTSDMLRACLSLLAQHLAPRRVIDPFRKPAVFRGDFYGRFHRAIGLRNVIETPLSISLLNKGPHTGTLASTSEGS